ncbi:unannotated protein [freshwater metagenome]|jgi:hypothetical protein|uniref:Unannotated protein n=1 Tax=freshwater metagenome TaxID=449393 RepID=A0A6J6CZC8_9ZZZZ
MRSLRHAVDRGATIPDVGAGSDQTGAVSDRVAEESCELCEAARVTEWYHEDDLCWVAECEACFVPMVVWKRHDPNPPEEVRVVLHQRLGEVAARVLGYEYWIDDRLRTIPTHYHAHSRRRWR